MSEAPVYRRFFAELKRRHVFRVTAVYGAAAFVIMQVADIAFEPLGLPAWTLTFLILLLLLGLPIAVILAWAFDLTPDGVRKTRDAAPGELTEILSAPARVRWPAGLLALVGIAALAWGSWLVGKRAGESEARDVQTADTTAMRGMEGADATGVALAYAELSRDARPSIAVLPFEDMSREGDQEYFSDGMTEEILTVLARIPEIRVAARTTAFAYKGKDLDLRDVGTDLGVRYVLEGSVRKDGDDIRITAQLIDTQDNFHVWSESYDRRLDRVFEIQSEIAEAIAGALRVPLGVEDRSTLVTPTGDMTAYDLYLAGRARVRDRGAANIVEAIALFEAAIERDSAWAPAWSGLAMAWALEPYYRPGLNSTSPDAAVWEAAFAEAERAALRAIELDPDNAAARVALGGVYRDRWEWERSEAEYLRALAADPDNDEAYQQYADLMSNVGRLSEALNTAARAIALDRSPIRLAVYAYIASLNDRYEEAIELGLEAARGDPDANIGLVGFVLVDAFLATGRFEEAHRIATDRGRADLKPMIEAVRTGDVDRLREIPDPSLRIRPRMMLGQPDGVFEDLDDGFLDPPFQGRSEVFTSLLDPIRGDPRFQSMLARMELAGVEPVRAPPPRTDGD
jgi:TolB-like protein